MTNDYRPEGRHPEDTTETLGLERESQWQTQRRLLLKTGVAAVGEGLAGHFAYAATANGAAVVEYTRMDATSMADAVRRGLVGASELLEAAFARCDVVNPKVNAVVARHDERARALLASRKLKGSDRSGTLAGIPFLVKDLNTYLAGTVTTNGSRFFATTKPAEYTSTLIARYEEAGAVAFGKNASPEFGLSTSTESKQWGETRNPWNLSLSAGGSSGGAAAAVAAGIVPVAHATDGGGSIRIPASYCGLFGMKPSRYRTPSGPGHFEGWFGASVGHVVSRSVRDSALLLDVGQGREKGSPYWTAPRERPFVDEVQRTPGKLRIALVSDSLTGVALDPAVQKSLDDTVHLMLSLGHEIENARLPLQPQELFGAHGAVANTALLTAIRDREKVLGRAFEPDELEPITRHILRTAQDFSGEKLYRARQSFETISFAMENMFERYDVILSPVTANITPPLGKLTLDQPYEDYAKVMMGSAGFTVVANVSGQPAMSVPLGWSDEGLPIGMMFTAQIGAEGLLFQLAGQLERERPWASRYPLI